MEGSKPPRLPQRFAALQLVLFIIRNSCIISGVFTIIEHSYHELLKMSKIKAHYSTLRYYPPQKVGLF